MFRQHLKSNRMLHRSWKMARDLGKFPLMQNNGLRALPTIWKIYDKTMLPPVRLFNFCQAVDVVNTENIPGDIVECGVWSGGALACAALWNERTSKHVRRYIGFDSFEGLPPPTPEDDDVFTRFNAASVAKGRVVNRPLMHTGVCVGDAADSVRQFFRNAGVPVDKTQLHAGWFQETLPVHAKNIHSIAVLRIDGDWYDSTKVCLDQLYDHVPAGGFIIIDDYGCFTGCRKAVDEFRETRSITVDLKHVDEHCVYWRKAAR